jgi:hypothetical protein
MPSAELLIGAAHVVFGIGASRNAEIIDSSRSGRSSK